MHVNSLKPLIHLNSGEKSNNAEVCFDLYALGRDLILVISGGQAHLGAVACSNYDQPKAFGLKDHKELEIVEMVAKEISSVTNRELLVVGGIHYDDITKEQIAEVLVNCNQLTATLKEEVEALKLDFHS